MSNPILDNMGIDHNLLRSLLREMGWLQVGGTVGAYSAWAQRDDEENEILLPENVEKGDYNVLLERARNRIVHQHGVAAQELLSTLLLRSSAMLDATKWTKETPVEAGIIDWRIGESLYATARLALVAAAKASKESKRYFGNSASHIAKRLLDETLMGQTEVGSFVVTAYTPSGGRYFFSKTEEDAASGKLLDAKSRTGADIIDKLTEIVSSVRESLDVYRKVPRIEQFDELVQVGFSYEMAKSLAELCSAGVGGLTIERVLGGNPAALSREFEFISSESQVLSRVAERFSETREPRTARLVGEVSLLEHLRTAEEHTIRLHVSNQADMNVVRVNLSAEQYKVALAAHTEEIPLLVSGKVETEKNHNWVREPLTVSLYEAASIGDGDDEENEPEEFVQEGLF